MRRCRGPLLMLVASAAMTVSAGPGIARSAAGDPVQAFLTAKTVRSGRPLIIRLVLSRPMSVTIKVLRLRPAHGRGRHHRRARYVRLVSAPFVCVQGLNRLEIARWHRRKFTRGRYLVVAVDPHFHHRIRIRIVDRPRRRRH